MPADRLVSVVLPCHDLGRWPLITAGVQALRGQTLPATDIVLAVDHCPELADRARSELAGVRVVQNAGAERGASATRNAGAAVVTTPLIAFLDDDQIPDPSWLEELVAPLVETSVVGTGGHSPALWQQGRPAWFPPAFGWVVGTHDDTAPRRPTRVRNVWSGNMAIRRDVFEAVGGFRSGFGKVGQRSQPEDTDLCLRAAAQHGGDWVYVPTAVAVHHVPAGRATVSFFIRRCFSEGQGKVVMRRLNRDLQSDVLADEQAFVRRTVPRVARREVAAAGVALGRLAALGIGLGAAAAGAASASWPQRRRRSHHLATDAQALPQPADDSDQPTDAPAAWLTELPGRDHRATEPPFTPPLAAASSARRAI